MLVKALGKTSIKYNPKLFDQAKQSARDALKTDSKRAIHKTAWATDDLNGNKIADKITKISRTSQQNSLEAIIKYWAWQRNT